jgi:hypothetical protein
MVITYIAQAHGGAVRTLDEAPPGFRLANATVSYARYLLMTFWPQNLTVYYPSSAPALPELQLIGAVVLLVAISVLCFLQRQQRPYLLIGWLWFVGDARAGHRDRAGRRPDHGRSLPLCAVDRAVHRAGLRHR